MDDVTVLTACSNARKLMVLCEILGLDDGLDPVVGGDGPHPRMEIDADHFRSSGPTQHPHPDPYFWEKGFEDHEP